MALKAGNAGVAGVAGTATAGGAAATHQAGQSILASDLSGAISTAAWPQLDPRDVRGSLPRFLTLIMALIHRYGTASSVYAAQFYRTARADAGIRGTVTVRPEPLPPAEQVTKSLEWATSGLYREVTPQTERAALTKVEGLTQTLALNMGRQTIIEAVKTDRQAKGWARVPEAGACSFCLLLATRGAVYKSKTSAGGGKFKTHDHCHCHVEPTFSDHYEPTALVRQAQDLYAATPYGDNPNEARNNFRAAVDQARDAGRL